MVAKKFDFLLLFYFIFAVIVILIGIYGRITDNYNLLPLSLILLSILLFIMGLREYKRTQSLLWGILI